MFSVQPKLIPTRILKKLDSNHQTMRSHSFAFDVEYTALTSDSLWFSRITNSTALILIIIIFIIHLIILCKKRITHRHKTQIPAQSPVPTPPSRTRTLSATPMTMSSSMDLKQHQNRDNRSGTFSEYSTSSDSDDPMRCYIQICNILIIATMFAAMANWIFNLLNDFYLLEKIIGGRPKYCGYYMNMSPLFWHTTKNLMYYLFVSRIAIAFNDSVYQYSPMIIRGMFMVITIWWIFAIYGDIVHVYGEWMEEPNGGWWCETYLASYGVPISFGVDIIISIICLYLFVRPLFLLLRESQCNDNDMLLNCVIRYTLLTFIAVLSTAILCIIAIMTGIGDLIIFDSLINIICLLLMTSSYQRYYEIICKSCHHVIYKLAKKSPDKELVDNISLKVNK